MTPAPLPRRGTSTSYVYTGRVAKRTTGRGGGINLSPKAQHRCKDGKYINAGILNRLSPDQLRTLAEWMDGYGLSGDLSDEKYP